MLQDFYANIFMLNLVSFLAEPALDSICDSSKDCKYRQQINWASAIGDVRERLVLLFLRGAAKIDSIIKSMWGSFKANTDAIKPWGEVPARQKEKGLPAKSFYQLLARMVA